MAHRPVIRAPRFHGDSTKVNGPLQRVSLSTAVRYDDLDLRSRRGAWELRMRVRDAAQDMCLRLSQAYPYEQANGTSCYKTALQDALLHANEAIDDARISYRLYRD
jgi:UrcA family protein